MVSFIAREFSLSRFLFLLAVGLGLGSLMLPSLAKANGALAKQYGVNSKQILILAAQITSREGFSADSIQIRLCRANGSGCATANKLHLRNSPTSAKTLRGSSFVDAIVDLKLTRAEPLVLNFVATDSRRKQSITYKTDFRKFLASRTGTQVIFKSTTQSPRLYARASLRPPQI